MAAFPNGFGKNTTGFAQLADEMYFARVIYAGEEVKGIAMYDNLKDLEEDKTGSDTRYVHARVYFTKD